MRTIPGAAACTAGRPDRGRPTPGRPSSAARIDDGARRAALAAEKAFRGSTACGFLPWITGSEAPLLYHICPRVSSRHPFAALIFARRSGRPRSNGAGSARRPWARAVAAPRGGGGERQGRDQCAPVAGDPQPHPGWAVQAAKDRPRCRAWAARTSAARAPATSSNRRGVVVGG